MPGRDGTGPLGTGAFGRGLGQGRGRGLGLECRRSFFPECRRGLRFEEGAGPGIRAWRFWGGGGETFASDKEILEEQKDYLQDRLESIEKRLAEL